MRSVPNMLARATIAAAAIFATVTASAQGAATDPTADEVRPSVASDGEVTSGLGTMQFAASTLPEAAFDAVPEPGLEGFRPAARPGYMVRYPVTVQTGAPIRPRLRDFYIPAARWDNRPQGDLWTRTALTALRENAPGIVDVVPRDIQTWCPAYPENSDARRRAFWVGLMSALAWHESRHQPTAVGGGNQWFGLLQIFPPTARGYDCRARTGTDLTDPLLNLSCATRIMAVTVARDNAIALNDGRWRGIAADWGPMVQTRKREDMIDWVSGQDYCVPQVMSVPRPPARPAAFASLAPVAPTPATLDARVSTSTVPAAVMDRLGAGTLDFSVFSTID